MFKSSSLDREANVTCRCSDEVVCADTNVDTYSTRHERGTAVLYVEHVALYRHTDCPWVGVSKLQERFPEARGLHHMHFVLILGGPLCPLFGYIYCVQGQNL